MSTILLHFYFKKLNQHHEISHYYEYFSFKILYSKIIYLIVLFFLLNNNNNNNKNEKKIILDRV